ncbi:hypothetical protein CH352_03050 [Leptospira hartskeerlii]|uniref:Uncharacterized protein n=1 Tax=Leptospira hartskeerlii TaxID=2023177 RepID=A0A2M9XGZ6_9LEPT|nr:hypothetical protein [Leptospira hartskeerlii]PJZ26919.1 hypothetical protein CH357_05405 [Leptospira hartskeerlii]PJZ34599.1 hypothetical protein CH352_03050 [Leptospira hartskeerlii]
MNLLSDALLLHRLSSDEQEFLVALLKWKGIDHLEWVRSSGFPSSTKEVLVWKKDASPEDVRSAHDWSREVSLIGRFDSEEKNSFLRAGATRIYDLNSFALEEFPFFKFSKPLHPEMVVLTQSSDLFSKFRSLLRACGSNAHWCKDILGLPNMLKETKPGVLILDSESFSIRELVPKMKGLLGTPYFPLSFCLIDFNKENVYQNLATGLKDIAKAFFEPKDLLLFLRDRLALASPPKDSFFQAIDWSGSPRNIREYEFPNVPDGMLERAEAAYLYRIRRLFLWMGEGANRGTEISA